MQTPTRAKGPGLTSHDGRQFQVAPSKEMVKDSARYGSVIKAAHQNKNKNLPMDCAT